MVANKTENKDIFFNEGRLCLVLARDTVSMRGFELPQQKESALLYHNGEFSEVNWQSVTIIDGNICLAFMPNDRITVLPHSASELATTLKDRSIGLIMDLSYALEKAGKRIAWSFNSIPLSSFYFLDNGDILLMSAQLADIIDYFHFDTQRFDDREKWYAHNCVYDFGYAHFLFQLVYFSMTGIAPFESAYVRETGFRPIPMNLYFAPDNTAIQGLCTEVDKALCGNKKLMFSVKKPFDYFRDAINATASGLTARDIGTADNPHFRSYTERRNLNARRNVFWRKKGIIVVLCALAAAAVIGIASFYIYQAVRAPNTKDLNEVEIIEYYYDALSNLDVSQLTEPLKNGYDGPDMYEVSTIYVTSTMQKAYGSQSLYMTPADWIDAGRPALVQNGYVYGITDLTVTQVSDDVFRASFLRWTTENLLEDASTEFDAYDETKSCATIYVFRDVVDFTFRTRKTWREVTDITEVSLDLHEILEIPYIEGSDNTNTDLATLGVMSTGI